MQERVKAAAQGELRSCRLRNPLRSGATSCRVESQWRSHSTPPCSDPGEVRPAGRRNGTSEVRVPLPHRGARRQRHDASIHSHDLTMYRSARTATISTAEHAVCGAPRGETVTRSRPLIGVREVGAVQELGLAPEVGSAQEVGPAQVVGPVREVGPAQEAGKVLAQSRLPTGPAQRGSGRTSRKRYAEAASPTGGPPRRACRLRSTPYPTAWRSRRRYVGRARVRLPRGFPELGNDPIPIGHADANPILAVPQMELDRLCPVRHRVVHQFCDHDRHVWSVVVWTPGVTKPTADELAGLPRAID